MKRVQVLYDFAGESNSSEITINVGEILEVTNVDVGEGWWEGTNSRGERGLFPAAYVEILSDVPAPPPQQTKSVPPPLTAAPIFQQPTSSSSITPPQSGDRYDRAADEFDDWEDDWDNDNDTYAEIGPTQSNQTPMQNQKYYANANLPPTPHITSDDAISMVSNISTKKSSSKMFSKSGDSYLMGTAHFPVPENEHVIIIQNDQGIFWKAPRDEYTVVVDSPKKETKFKGMKSFIAYQLTPSFNNQPVSRRYKHFDWLHERLVDKFSLIPIPPLPDKQISGRYEEQFIEHRRVQLQDFIDWVCRHPVLSVCEVWMHFLVCNDDKKWKTGKRAAEKDPLTGVSFCAAIAPPDKPMRQSILDPQIDSCTSFVHSMDGAVKTLLSISNEQTKKYQLQWKKDYQRIGEGLSEMARALEIDERRAVTSFSMSNAVGQTAGVFINIAQIYGDQPKQDWIPLSDRLHIYRGILGGFPDILSEHKNAMQKRKECERLTANSIMDNSQLQLVTRRTDIVSYALLAEMSNFRSERDVHLRGTIKNFLAAQIEFHQTVVQRLQMALQFFD